MSDKELIQQVLNNKALIENLTQEQISQKAIDYINGNKDFLKTITFKYNTKYKRQKINISEEELNKAMQDNLDSLW